MYFLGDLILGDMGDGLPFKAGAFDGAISISALQWLCNADKAHHKPAKRLFKFFTTLYACLKRGGRAIFQFYPENPSQIELITSQAMKSGFTGKQNICGRETFNITNHRFQSTSSNLRIF